MRFTKPLAAVLMIGSTSLVSAVPAVSAPLLTQPSLSSSLPTSIETVQFRRHGGHGFRGGHGHHRGHGAGALIGGLAAGAIIGGVIAAGSAANAAANDRASYCAQRYRSYDPSSGTYLSTNGNRYACR